MIISVAGGTGSGKTTISKQIASKLRDCHDLNVVIISMDNYYKNIHEEFFENYDHPLAFNEKILFDDLQNFINNKTIPIRSYCYQTKQTDIISTNKAVDILILEGLYAFYNPKIRLLCEHKLYLDLEESVRLERRVNRDKIERGISAEENLKMINDFVKKMHKEFVSTQIEFADKVYREEKDLLLFLNRILSNCK